MMKHQPITTSLRLAIGVLAGIGIATPLRAQVEAPPAIDPAVIEAPEVDTPAPDPAIPDDDVGLPEGAESPPDAGLPDAGEVIDSSSATLDQVILLTVDGVPRYYAPVNVNAAQLEGVDVPTYTLGETGAATADDADAATPEGREPMVTYPPADSLEDLDPEDIVE